MIYLLDVNALLALSVLRHEFHERMTDWISQLTRNEIPELATCSITELGFVRVLCQAEKGRFSVSQARELLHLLKSDKTAHYTFIVDGHDISHLPDWVKSPNQTTDGHLVELAKANGARLSTLDEKIKGAFLIPQSR
jgi:predicted nucleic acid-binding protein